MFRPRGIFFFFAFAFVLYLWAWQHLLPEISFGSFVHMMFGLQWQAGCQARLAARGTDPLGLASLRSSQQIFAGSSVVLGWSREI